MLAGRLADQLGGSERALGNGDIPGIHPLVPRTDFYKIIPGELMDGFKGPVFGKFRDEDILKQLLVFILTGLVDGSGFLCVANRLD